MTNLTSAPRLEGVLSITHCKLRTNPCMEPWETHRFGTSIACSMSGGLTVRKLVLTICLLSVVAPFAAAQNGGNQNGQFPQKPKGHAPEMSSIAMAVAGVIGLGGYLLIRRRVSPQN